MSTLASNIQKHSSLRGTNTTELDTELAAKDDWRITTNPAERRRRQNRLNQRAYRERKRQEAQLSNQTPQLPQTDVDQSQVQTEQQMLEKFALTAYRSYVLGSPSIDQLLALTKVNVYRAFICNIGLLGLEADGLCEADVLSPFNQPSPPHFITTTLPPSLQPTPRQRSVPHHPWLDFFPHPKARENLICALDCYDEDKFAMDILGFWSPDPVDNMLIVWGEPYDPENWEVTECFIKKWGWVIRGCPDILRNTNKWRARRGETPLLRYL